MLKRRHYRHHRQRGFSLIVALIALAIMALAAVSLMRTVSTATLVSGNLAFEQAAVTGADVAVEAAVAWLENHTGLAGAADTLACPANTSSVLACDQVARGYLATRLDPVGSQSWADVFGLLQTAAYGSAVPVALPDANNTKNTAAYLIQRLCRLPGDASSAIGCSTAPSSAYCGSSKTLGSNAGAGNLACNSPTYYRITVRVTGPRNTTAYVQAMVAL